MTFVDVMHGLFGFIYRGKPVRVSKDISFLVILFLLSSFLASCNPQADLSADPVSGNAPLSVTFDASASTVTSGDIVSYEWDFDGDGVVDMGGADLAKVKHTYGRGIQGYLLSMTGMIT